MAKTSSQLAAASAERISSAPGGASRGNRSGGQRGEKDSVSGYFRKIIEERPELLDSKSNAELLGRWLEDHPGEKAVPRKIKQNLANIKSILRKKRREKHGGKTAGLAASTSRTASKGLEWLEENIDECLTLAKNQDRDELASIIKLLRRARNEVVWKMGQD